MGPHQTLTSDFNLGYYSYNRPEIQQLVSSSSRRILDVGCATGMMGHELKQKLRAEVWGVEFEPKAAEQAEKRLDRVLTGPIEEVMHDLPDGYFDTVILADVLEHLTDPWNVLKNLRSKISTKGEVVVSIPNVRHWSVIKHLLEGSWSYQEAGILDKTHLRFFTRTECINLLETSGYNTVRCEAIIIKGDEPVPGSIVNSLRENGLDVRTLAEESLHYQYAFVAKPVPVAPHIATSKKSVVSGLTSIIILTWNGLSHTQTCLASIARNTTESYELIVIDNGSTDGTVAWLQEQATSDSRIRLIVNVRNVGFAAGCNQGIMSAYGEYILLLNNDTVVTTGWLTGLREVVDRYTDTGIVGPMTNSASGVQVVANVGYRSLEELPGWAMSFREFYRYRVIPQRQIVGFCMLFKSELAEKIGLLDESFGSGNFEDDDYCLRAELTGYRNLIAGDVFIHHVGGATFSGNGIPYSESITNNRELYRNKWSFSTLDKATLRRLIPLNACTEAICLSMRGNVNRAIALLMQKGIKVAPDLPSLYTCLAEILISAGRYSDALQVLPEMPSATNREVMSEIAAICHAALGNDKMARQSARDLADNHRALVVSGTLAARKGDLAGAEVFFRRAIEADPSRGDGRLSLGMLLWSRGENEESWRAVKRSVLVDPLNDEAMKILRDMADRNQRHAEVLAIASDAVLLYPESRNLARHHAELLTICGHEGQSLDVCESFLVKFGMDDDLLELALHLRQHVGVYDHLAVAGPHSISLCMIVKNEGENLPACLASLKPVVHEMIIVDTGSTDRTADIAAAFGAKVFSFAWNGNFSSARNYALDAANGHWILVMDADEVLSSRDYELLCNTVQENSHHQACWSVTTRNYTRLHPEGWVANNGGYPREERAEGWHPSQKVRLFPNDPRLRFTGDVHEMIEHTVKCTNYRIQEAPFVIHHYGGLTDRPEKNREKKESYYQMGKQKLLEHPDDLPAIGELAVQAAELEYYEEAIELWNRFLRIAPDSAVALFNKGFSLMRLNRFSEALDVTRRALEVDNYHKEAAFNYGICALYAGEPREAITKLEFILKMYADHPPLLAVLTLLHRATGEIKCAEVYQGILQRINYSITDFISGRIAVLRRIGRNEFADALETF
jgi:GT2 family glycosyltransferase/2-polyprenyl-3-methyl-5-hydroxy-6-metoxy-1,4-benzoquinol methylase/Flp pilus assembly protein TadD